MPQLQTVISRTQCLSRLPELDPAHTLIVRQNGAGYEIISGHHRALAARKAGLTEVPCWVRDLSDEDAYMALAARRRIVMRCLLVSRSEPVDAGIGLRRQRLSACPVSRHTGAKIPELETSYELARESFASKSAEPTSSVR